ncbi:hypothetical protein POSPLADRAFT_1184293 [Postia placenta MAD-698-R-SB12]|uniref:Uncharacterized protein n=1 Tax=Postia placenta MAD-698-R-SB12 TaxID=670580 RepID=A0A1X6MTD9_9APHY|nr:hypothetical protein POSPLADRAFT_1184293 [Postia placenta MAD-698-R-SB12]OSX59530.1 hypothetical protein POSPLADRAFT_1184293 [Postia placenta MAD-698-R-SB12]
MSSRGGSATRVPDQAISLRCGTALLHKWVRARTFTFGKIVAGKTHEAVCGCAGIQTLFVGSAFLTPIPGRGDVDSKGVRSASAALPRAHVNLTRGAQGALSAQQVDGGSVGSECQPRPHASHRACDRVKMKDGSSSLSPGYRHRMPDTKLLAGTGLAYCTQSCRRSAWMLRGGCENAMSEGVPDTYPFHRSARSCRFMWSFSGDSAVGVYMSENNGEVPEIVETQPTFQSAGSCGQDCNADNQGPVASFVNSVLQITSAATSRRAVKGLAIAGNIHARSG